MDLLLNIQRKTEIFASFINELENAKADMDNNCSLYKISDIKEIIDDFYHLYKKMDKDSIEKLQKKIKKEMASRCNHAFSDIENNIEYCEICGLEK